MIQQLTQDQKDTMTAKVKAMFNFTVGQKVMWAHGKYDYYHVQAGYKADGEKSYDIADPYGNILKVSENECISYY